MDVSADSTRKKGFPLVEFPPDRYVRVGQVRTRFWAVGDAGPAVVLIHGLGGYVEDWMHNVSALAEQHRVYAVDLMGCGRSDKPRASYSLPSLARFVDDFMAVLELEQASLIGHSLGGAVAIHLAIQAADRVSKLVLVCSAGLGREVTHTIRFSALPLVGEWLTRPTRWGIARSLRRSVADERLVTDRLVDMCYHLASLPGARDSMLAMSRAVANMRGIRDDVTNPILDYLPRITAPVLLVWGKQDCILPVDHAYEAKRRMPNARLLVLDPCGHFPQLEHPQEFNGHVLRFLAES